MYIYSLNVVFDAFLGGSNIARICDKMNKSA